jgi:ATP-dependent exoDNAse (exonuclease V) beta subunit
MLDLQEVYDTERHLLYVACTRDRDHLPITGVDPVSEFLDDLIVKSVNQRCRSVKVETPLASFRFVTPHDTLKQIGGAFSRGLWS